MSNLSFAIIMITIGIATMGAVFESFFVSFVVAPVFFFVAVILGHVYRSISSNFKG
ncbi:MAG: hypothetical protein WC688_07335 [Parachlamydiales bacterium]|jgi:hypothetical protein